MSKRMQGFTLIEILIAIVIVGILAAIALPSYNNQVTRSRRSDCMGVLLGLAQAMEKYNAVQFTYLGAADEGADTGAPASTLYPDTCPIDGNATFYNLTIAAATATTFTVQATPVAGSPQAGDGILQVNSLGQRVWDENGDGDIADTDRNWEPN